MQSGTWTITAPAPRSIDDRFLTVGEVAETCRLSEKAIRRAIDRGQLKAFKLCHRIRISHEDMREWIASQRQPVVTIAPPDTRPTGVGRRPQQRRRATAAAGRFRALVSDTDLQEQAG